MTSDPAATELAANTCLVAAEFTPNLPQALRLANRASGWEGSNSATNSASGRDAFHSVLDVSPAPTPANPRLQLLAGMAAYRAGRPAEATSLLQPLARADAEQGLLALYFLSLAHHELNQPEKAEAWLLAANRGLDERLHTGALLCKAESLETAADMCAVLLVRSEAERKVWGRDVSPAPEAGRLAAARQAWSPVLTMLDRAREHSLEHRWQQAADAFDQALKDPAFNWGAARLEVPDLGLWAGIALMRAGDQQRHAQFCRTMVAAVPSCAAPDSAAETAARACLLPPAPGPVLLGLASNLLAHADSDFTDHARREGRQLTLGLLGHRSGRYAEAVPLLQQAASSTNLQLRATAQVLRALAAKQLGQKAEAEDLWREAKRLLPEATESGETPTRFPDLQVFLLLLDEADALFPAAP